MRYAWIETQRDCYPLGLLCRVLQVSRSGYYAWRRREPSATALGREKPWGRGQAGVYSWGVDAYNLPFEPVESRMMHSMVI